jgi:outer membrane protein with beta-barrel domain
MARPALTAVALALALSAAPARAQRPVELAPFAGMRYGGGVQGIAGGHYSMGVALEYGATLDIPFNDSWNVEVLYAREQTHLSGPGPGIEVAIERYLAGVVEEHDHGATRFFGVGLVGATRLVPPGDLSSSAHFTLAAGLGVKHRLSDRFALRAEARGFYLVTDSSSAFFCGGVRGCLFLWGSSGLLQGDLTAGIVVKF